MKHIGYLHVHSKYSDGDLSLSEIKRIFLGKGASFIFLAEHEELLNEKEYFELINECNRLNNESFLLVPGLESVCGENHLLIYGAKKIVPGKDIVEKIKMHKEDGCVIIWAHPHKSNYIIEPEIFSLLDGMEIWNSSYDGKNAPRFNSLNFAKKKASGLALLPGLDFHRAAHQYGPKIAFNLNNLNYKDIAEQIKLGKFLVGSEERGVDSFLKKNTINLKSLASIFFLHFFKKLNAIFFRFHIKAPRRIKDRIRKIF